MPVTLLIENIPYDVADRLKARATRNQRSLQKELLVILESALRHGPLTVEELAYQIRALGLTTNDDSSRFLREDRDCR